MSVTITITNAGRAAIVNAHNTGTAPVTITQIGISATAHTPAPANTSLPGEIKRLSAVSGLVVADDTIHVSVSDTSADAYALRSFALYLADGTLFAIYGQSTPILNKVAASIAALSVDVIFADISAASLTFGDAAFVNPPASTTVQGVVELATVAEAQAGIDALRALTPASAKAAILGWLLAVDGAGSGLDADLLDGQHGSYYADIPARLGYTPLNQASYTGAEILARLLGVDGAGSGLDADLLDGLHASSFAQATVTEDGAAICLSFRVSGNDWYLQAGTGFLGANSSGVVNFPQAYSTKCFFIAMGGSANTSTEGDAHNTSNTLSTGSVTNSANTGVGFTWFALGR